MLKLRMTVAQFECKIRFCVKQGSNEAIYTSLQDQEVLNEISEFYLLLKSSAPTEKTENTPFFSVVFHGNNHGSWIDIVTTTDVAPKIESGQSSEETVLLHKLRMQEEYKIKRILHNFDHLLWWELNPVSGNISIDLYIEANTSRVTNPVRICQSENQNTDRGRPPLQNGLNINGLPGWLSMLKEKLPVPNEGKGWSGWFSKPEQEIHVPIEGLYFNDSVTFTSQHPVHCFSLSGVPTQIIVKLKTLSKCLSFPTFHSQFCFVFHFVCPET